MTDYPFLSLRQNVAHVISGFGNHSAVQPMQMLRICFDLYDFAKLIMMWEHVAAMSSSPNWGSIMSLLDPPFMTMTMSCMAVSRVLWRKFIYYSFLGTADPIPFTLSGLFRFGAPDGLAGLNPKGRLSLFISTGAVC